MLWQKRYLQKVGVILDIYLDYYSKKQGWSYKTDKDRITVKTSEIHNTPPYQRNKSRKTVSVNDPNNIKKLKEWAEEQW